MIKDSKPMEKEQEVTEQVQEPEKKHRVSRLMRTEQHRQSGWGGARNGAGRKAEYGDRRETISPRISPRAKALYHAIKKQKHFNVEHIIEDAIENCAEAIGIEL